MCTFEDHDRVAIVCDVALAHVREEVTRQLDCPDAARFIHREGQGTLVELEEGLDRTRFRAAVEDGMQRAASEST